MSFKVQSDFFYTEEEVGITTSLRHTILLVKNPQIQEAGNCLFNRKNRHQIQKVIFRRRDLMLQQSTRCARNERGL